MNSDLDELSGSRLHFIQSAMSLVQLIETDRRIGADAIRQWN